MGVATPMVTIHLKLVGLPLYGSLVGIGYYHIGRMICDSLMVVHELNTYISMRSP